MELVNGVLYLLLGICGVGLLGCIIVGASGGFKTLKKKSKVKNSNQIKILSYTTRGPKSLDGWDYMIEFGNGYDKTVKYVVFHVNYYNRVGDLAKAQISEDTGCNLQYTGPFQPNEIVTGEWDNICFYSGHLRIIPYKIDVEFMDGSKDSYQISFS